MRDYNLLCNSEKCKRRHMFNYMFFWTLKISPYFGITSRNISVQYKYVNYK